MKLFNFSISGLLVVLTMLILIILIILQNKGIIPLTKECNNLIEFIGNLVVFNLGWYFGNALSLFIRRQK